MFTPKSMGAAILHLSSHAFTKICLFYGMGSIYSLKRTNKITDLIGVAEEMPKTSFIILLASLSLIGIPPFGGFISKFYIILAAAEDNQKLVLLTLGLSTLLSGLYLIRVVTLLYKPEVVNYSNIAPIILEKKLPRLMLFSLVLCSCGIIFFYFIHIFIKQFFIYIT